MEDESLTLMLMLIIINKIISTVNKLQQQLLKSLRQLLESSQLVKTKYDLTIVFYSNEFEPLTYLITNLLPPV